MERSLVFALFLLTILPVCINSSRFLVGDELAGGKQNDTSQKIPTLPPESTPDKKPSLTSLNVKTESLNKSQLEPPVLSQLEKNKTLELSPPVEPDKNDNKQDKNNNTVLLSPPQKEKQVNDTETEKQGHFGNFKQSFCDDVASEKCSDENKWVACLQFPSNDSKEIFLVVENKGGNEISLDINYTPSIILETKKLHLLKTESNKVKIIKADPNKAANITLNAGKGDCILHITPSKTLISDWQLQIQQLTNYATTKFSPIYYLYFFILLTLVISVTTFACCKFTRGRKDKIQNGGSSYKQLEMSEIETGATSASATSAGADVAETADGWERGWDDDWDDEEGRGVFANSLSSRVNNNNNNNGWDVDWDD